MRFNIKSSMTAGALGLAVLFLMSACKGGGTKDPNALSSKYNQTFASAPPEVKSAWDVANQALATNGYAVAIMSLQTLLQQPSLTPEQSAAAKETVDAVSAKMYAEAGKGNAAARQSIEDLRNARNR